MTEELGSIGVKLRVDLSDLDRAETAARRKISGIAREHTISFKVGSVNTAEVQKQIRAIAQGKLDVKVGVSLPANAGRQLKSQLQSQLRAAGPVTVNVTANLSTAELNRIKSAIGKAGIRLTGTSGGSGGPSPSAPITPHERKIIAETAAAHAKAIKSTPAKPSAAASVERFDPAYKVPAGAAAALQRRAAEDLGKAAKATEVAAKSAKASADAAGKTAKAAAAVPRPSGAISRPIADFGGLPTGPAVGVSIAPDASGRRRVVPEPTKGVGKRLSRAGQRASSQGISYDSLKREKARGAQVAPEDEEYAGRRLATHLPLDEQGIYEMERSGRGVRGAGRSGARQKNEPVLTAAERQAIGDKQDIMSDEASAEADARVRAPARRSSAYLGDVRSKSPFFQRVAAGVQFTRFDPALAKAQKALEGGDLDGARAALRGFSGQLAGADPRQRKKFFRLFRNVENAPPEVLEKHAALQSLFAEIGIQEAAKRVATTQATLDPFRKGKSGKALRESAPDAYQDAMEAAKAAKRFEDQMLRGLRPRAGGGRVEGDLAEAVFEHMAQKRRHKMTDAINYDMPHLSPQEKAFRRHQLSRLESPHKTHEITGAELDPEIQHGQLMSGFPFHDLFSPEGMVGDVEHNPFGGSIHQMFGETRPFIPKRAGGGPVGGGLMARLAAAKAAKAAYLVADGHKDELFVGDSGKMEILKQPAHVRTFDESGTVKPFVPEWVRRGMAKDLTHRAPGGPVRGFGGTKFRSFVEGEKEAITAGVLTRGDSASVQRVFVVNFPSGGGIAGNQRGGSVAAGPLRFSSDKDATKFAKEMGGQIGAELQNILGSTQTVKAEPADAKAGGATLSAFERQQIGQQSRTRTSALESRIGAARSATAEAQQLIPVRSLSVAVGQIFSTIFGGRGDAITRAKQANTLASQATAATTRFRTAEAELLATTAKLNKEQDPKKQAQLIDQRRDQAKATRALFQEAKGLTEQSEKAAAGVITQAGALQNLSAGTIGVVGGTLLFSTALGAAQAGITAVSAVVGPAIERMTGFKNTTADTTKALADQTRAQSGAVKTSVALAEAQSGLADSVSQSISPLLEQRAQTEAGNLALVDGLKLVHSAIELRRQNAGNGGADQGIAATTGGFFGSIINGIPSTQEQVVNELGGALPKSGEFAANRSATDFLAKQPKRSLTQQLLDQYGVGAGNAVAPNAPPSAAGAASAVSDEFSKKLADSTVYIETFQGALDKAGKNFVLDAQKVGESDDELAKRNLDAATAAKAFGSAGLLDTAKLIRDTGLVIRDAQGNAIQTADQARQFFTDINKSFTTPDVGALLKQMTERIIPAQLASFRAQSNLQRQVINPAQFALGEIAQPTPGLSTSKQPFEAGLVGRDSLTGKIDKQAQAAANTVKGQLGGAIDFVNAQIQKGHDALVALVPTDLRSEFEGVLADITATGQQISKIQTGISQQQVNLDVAEYNNQLRIAKRSLQDAKDLQAGIAGATKETVGGLEGQNVALQRQLQLLEFELAQRKINFSIASAGFVAPGTTPEERAARIEEAKKEAEFAQKQLDIQKQLAGNQFKGIQITTSRDVTDLVAQIGLLEQGRTLTINTAVASKQLDILNKKQALLVEQAGTYIEEGVKITQAAIDATAEVQKQTGKGFAELLGETAKAWGIFGDQAKLVLGALTGSAPSAAATDNSGKGKYASGIVGDTLGPTEITVGEARGEKVAVIKNPKLVPSTSFYGAAAGGSSGGGAMIQMTVVISGNSVREEADLEALANKVAQKVEDRLMQKTSLFGLRRA